MDAFGNKGLSEVCQVHLSLLEREKLAGASLAHASIKPPTRAQMNTTCVQSPTRRVGALNLRCLVLVGAQWH